MQSWYASSFLALSSRLLDNFLWSQLSHFFFHKTCQQLLPPLLPLGSYTLKKNAAFDHLALLALKQGIKKGFRGLAKRSYYYALVNGQQDTDVHIMVRPIHLTLPSRLNKSSSTKCFISIFSITLFIRFHSDRPSYRLFTRLWLLLNWSLYSEIIITRMK